jgi:hypothetical protein
VIVIILFLLRVGYFFHLLSIIRYEANGSIFVTFILDHREIRYIIKCSMTLWDAILRVSICNWQEFKVLLLHLKLSCYAIRSVFSLAHLLYPPFLLNFAVIFCYFNSLFDNFRSSPSQDFSYFRTVGFLLIGRILKIKCKFCVD